MKNMKISMGRSAAIAALAVGMSLAAFSGSAFAQRAFASADEAASALVAAVKASDRKAVLGILGASAEKWLWSGDAVADRAAGEQFVASFEKQHAFKREADGRSTLVVGSDDWPFAFPLVEKAGKWHFDTVAGKDELLARRIGQNELDVINVMLAVVDAQRDYASAVRDGSGLPQYARKFVSTAGKQDGLYWATAAGAPPSPLGPLVASATREGYGKDGAAKSGMRVPYHGYYFRMLERQGAAAKGGAMDYVLKGRMIGGFAAIAWPAEHGNSGVMTFIVNQDGVVYQKDLGAETAKLASAITRFDPAAGWKPATLQ